MEDRGYGSQHGSGGGSGAEGSGAPFQRIVYDGKRMRKFVVRKPIDYHSSLMYGLRCRVWQRDSRDHLSLPPNADGVRDLHMMTDFQNNPTHGFCTKYVTVVINKIRCPVTSLVWYPRGHSLVTGAMSGLFTFWNGLTFKFETLNASHDDAVRSMVWTKDEQWLLSADQLGFVKYWQPTMNNVKSFRAHQECVSDISCSPSDRKFCTGSEDRNVVVWDFDRAEQELVLKGHGWDVKSVQWHPSKSLLISGSRDNKVKMWDPKSGGCVATIHSHKNEVSRVRWNQNGNWFVSGGRDNLIKIWDIRTMKEFQVCKGHRKEVTALAWHPHIERLFASGSYDGTIRYWIAHDTAQAEICGAHDHAVWDIAWHPVGHLLASVSQDNTTRFWCRNRPGDEMQDKHNANQLPGEVRNEALAVLSEVSKINPGKGRTLAVLEGYKDQEQNEEEDDSKSGFSSFRPQGFIPGMGSALDAKERAKRREEQQKKQEEEAQQEKIRRKEEEAEAKKAQQREDEQKQQSGQKPFFRLSDHANTRNPSDKAGSEGSQRSTDQRHPDRHQQMNDRAPKRERNGDERDSKRQRSSQMDRNYAESNQQGGNFDSNRPPSSSSAEQFLNTLQKPPTMPPPFYAPVPPAARQQTPSMPPMPPMPPHPQGRPPPFVPPMPPMLPMAPMAYAAPYGFAGYPTGYAVPMQVPMQAYPYQQHPYQQQMPFQHGQQQQQQNPYSNNMYPNNNPNTKQ